MKVYQLVAMGEFSHVVSRSVFRTADEANGYCNPFSFDITSVVKPGAKNTLAILCTRTFFNELGTGGLLSPVALYTEKPSSASASRSAPGTCRRRRRQHVRRASRYGGSLLARANHRTTSDGRRQVSADDLISRMPGT